MSAEKPPTNLYTALLAAMKACGPVIKNAQNPHLRNYYADLSAVFDAIEKPLWENGLLIVQRFQYDTVGRNGGREAEGTPILITELIHAASGECIASQVPVVSKDPTDPQKMGGAITYYRRYSLLALLGLAPEDDDGHAASQPRPQPAPARNAAPAFATPRPAPAPAPLPVAGSARSDEALIDMVRNDFATPDERWDALWDFYNAATDVADLNRRAEQVKASGMPKRELEAAYRQKHTALAAQLAPASIAG